MNLTDFDKEILGLCLADYIDFSLILRWGSEENFNKGQMPEWVKQKAFKTIQNLAENGLIEAGFPDGKGGFSSLHLNGSKTIEYIEQEWKSLGLLRPRLGDLCWFNSTPKGEEVAKVLGIEPIE